VRCTGNVGRRTEAFDRAPQHEHFFVRERVGAMGSSNKRAATGHVQGWPILSRLRGWLGMEVPTAPDWDAATEASAEDAACGALCVLVVDDSSFNRRLASELLLVWGVQPLLAADGEEAVKLAKEVRLDLVLMDLQMPVLDGRAATRRIRQEERTLGRPRVPIVAYSAMPISQAVLRSEGFDGALVKPCDSLAFRACLLKWCSSRGSIRVLPEQMPQQARQGELRGRVGPIRRQSAGSHRP
jgi:CheY-like chemotaxis protein